MKATETSASRSAGTWRRRRLTADARREQLIGAATRLFARRGFDGTTTAEIAKAARVSEAIIFKHFPCKEELYEAVLEGKAKGAGTDRWVAELRSARASGDAYRVIESLLTLMMEHGKRDPEFLRLMLHAALDRRSLIRDFRSRHLGPLHAELIRFVEDGQRAGTFRNDDARVLARILLAVPSYHALLEGLLGGDPLAPLPLDAPRIYADVLLNAMSLTGRSRSDLRTLRRPRRIRR